MNSDFLRWLLNVREIPKGSESLRLGWEHPWPSWLWALLIVCCGVLAFWSYRRLAGNGRGRMILAVTRMFLLVLALVLISGPMLELPRENIEQDWVVMLADRSASMNIKDALAGNAPPSETPSPRITRDDQFKQTINRHADLLKELSAQKHMVWLGFDAGAYAMGTSELATSAMPELGEAEGRRTNIEAAIEQALQRAAARQVSGIVLFSDGRTDRAPSRALIRRLQADAIPIFSIPLGPAESPGDLAVRRVEASQRAFVRDKVPVVVEIEGRGLNAINEVVTVKLVDQTSGELLDSREVNLADLSQSTDGSISLTLTGQPELVGETQWAAIIEPSAGREDLIPENNSRVFAIELIDRPLRVLYIDGYPRWEYRYVKNLLVREKTIESSVMLISADRDFAQEGNQPITRLPRSPEEFASFDVIILGDVPANFFSPSQLEMMRAHVADRGAGLLWIAGPRSLPSTYAGTALADVLPMRGSLKLAAINEPVTMTTTDLAERLGVLQLTVIDQETGWPQQLRDPQTGWSRLFFAQRIEPGLLKPAAEVLAETVNAYGGSPLPLVISMRFGAGQSMYVATDEIWRWRYGRGEMLHEQFWVQMIRMLGRESLITGGEPATITINPRRVAANQPMRIELRLLDSQLLQTAHNSIRAAIESADGQRLGEVELMKVEGSDDRFAATYMPDVAGPIRVRIDDATIPMLRTQTDAEVYEPDDELQQPQTDHELLAQLSAATGGKVLQPHELDQLRSLPNRAVKTINPLTEPIWDSPLALILALLALTAEWIGRKVLRLV